MIKVTNTVTIYEVDGKEQGSVPMPEMLVHSHWNRDSMVVIEAAGRRMMVSARDLQAAIANACNSGKH